MTTSRKVLLAAYAVVACICAFEPLADHIGYEFAVALTLCAMCFAPAVGYTGIRAEAKRDRAEQRPAGAAARAGFFAVGALVLPVAIILLNALRRPICDPVTGSIWLLLLPAPTAWIAATFGALAAAVFRRTSHAIAAIAFVELASPLVVFLGAYFGPSEFGLDHFVGYFTMFMRDDVPVTSAILSFRLSTILWGTAIVAVIGAVWTADAAVRRMHRSWAFALTSALTLVSIGWGTELGWRTTDASLRRALAAEQTINGVTVHYPRNFSDRSIDAMMSDVAYTSAETQRALGITAEHPVHIWVYQNGEQKARLVGGAFTNFAKPYRHELHIAWSGFPLGSLRHELIHVYAAEFAPGPWRASGGLIPNVALIEGLAEAYDIEDTPRTLYQDAKALRALGIAPDLRAMMSVSGFEGQGVSRAYAYSGAFVRYLGDQFGTTAVRRIYQTNDFSSLGSVDAIIAGFEKMLDTVTADANTRSDAARRHSEPAVTKRTCAREIYAVRDSARALATNRLWEQSLAMYDRVCRLQPENPEHLSGKMDIAIRMRPATIAPILVIAESLLHHPRLDPTLELLTHQSLGDYYLRLNDVANARREYTTAAALPAGPDTRRGIAVRLLSLDDSVRLRSMKLYFNIEGRTLVNIFTGIDLARTHPDDGLILYLLGRQYFQTGAYESANTTLARVDRLGLPDADLARETARLLVIGYAQRNRCDDAEASMKRQQSLGGAQAEIKQSTDWVNRCRFNVSHGFPPA